MVVRSLHAAVQKAARFSQPKGEILTHTQGSAMTMTPITPTGLKRRSEFLFVRDGDSTRRKTVVVQARKRGGAETRFGITATKRVGNAVIRNRAKRRLREAARRLLPKHAVPGVDYVFIARQETPIVEWQRLLDDIETALVTLANRLDLADGTAHQKTE